MSLTLTPIKSRINFLTGVMSCHHRYWASNPIRDTWLKDVNGRFDYKFFYGRGNHDNLQADEVVMDCDDAYRGLACKVQSSVKWALEHGYDGFFKADDDTYVRPERLNAAVNNDWAGHSYVGKKLGATDPYHTQEYARGGVGYFLSKKAMEVLANAPTPNPDIPSEYAEDSWVGKTLRKAGIECFNDDRLRCAHGSGPGRSGRPVNDTRWKLDVPRQSNQFITTCEFLGEEMRPVHDEWVDSCQRLTAMMSKLRIK